MLVLLRKNTRIHRKMGEIHELLVVLALSLVWFAWATPDFGYFLFCSARGRGTGGPRRQEGAWVGSFIENTRRWEGGEGAGGSTSLASFRDNHIMRDNHVTVHVVSVLSGRCIIPIATEVLLTLPPPPQANVVIPSPCIPRA